MTTAYRALAARLETNAVYLRRMMNNVAFGGDGLGITIKEPATLLEDLVEGFTALTSALDEIERLREALTECAAEWHSPPTTMGRALERVSVEFKRRMLIAVDALHRSGR